MKVTKIEKIIMGVICFMLIIMITCFTSCVMLINKAGDIDKVIIEEGKKVKNIVNEISESP